MAQPSQIRGDLLAFLTEPGEPIELWAWMAAYDHVALAQLWGDMRALPRAIPRFTHELRQRWEDAGARRCRRRRPTSTTRWPTPGTTWPAGRRWKRFGARLAAGEKQHATERNVPCESVCSPAAETARA